MAKIDPKKHDVVKLAKYPLFRNTHRVGVICTHWAQLEYMFALTIWHILGLDEETGKIVTGGLDMQPRLNMAINLARHCKQPREVIDALTAARAAIQDNLDIRRNRAVHGVTFLSDDFSIETEVHRGRGGRQRQPLPTEELIRLCDDLVALRGKLRQALANYVPAIKESAERADARIAAMMSSVERPSDSSPK